MKYSKKITKNYKLFYCSFETILMNDKYYPIFYSIVSMEGIKWFKSVDNINNKTIEIESNQLIENFLTKCFYLSLNLTAYHFFIFHNFFQYNCFFLSDYCYLNNKYNINFISRNTIVYKCVVSKKTNIQKKLVFRDSFLLFPFSLEIMVNTFLKKSLYDIQQNFIFENNKIVFESFKNNCLKNTELFSVAFTQYNNYIKDLFNVYLLSSLTLSSFSLKLFKLYYYKEDKYLIQPLSDNLENFIQKSYRGGIAEIYKPNLMNGYYYDINSLYPFVMKMFEMPLGKGIFCSLENSFDITKFFGFIEVEVESPKYLYIPFLTTVTDKKGCICPLGRWTDVYFSEEIKYALTLGYTFKYKKILKFEKGFIFKEYITDLYKIKRENSNNIINNIIKRFLNSLYGRFAMKNETDSIIILENSDKTNLHKFLFLYEIKKIENIYNKIVITYNNTIKADKMDYLLRHNLTNQKNYILKYNKNQKNLIKTIHIASAIAAYARIEIYKYKKSFEKYLYYSDTDSLFLIKKLPLYITLQKKIGFFKFEEYIKQGYFLSSKLYYIENYVDKEIKKNKRIKKESLSKENFIILYNNVNNKKEKNVQLLNGKFKKRKNIYSKSKLWLNTNPIDIE
jgi:hypothetical protein